MSRPLLLGLLAAAAVVLAAASLTLGPAPLGLARIAAVLGGGGDRVARIIVLELRLPRAILGLAVGAMLGASGAALQGYLRNPLAEPGVLGASPAAALGAVIALFFGFAAAHPWTLPAFAIAGAVAALVPLLLLAGGSPLGLVLAGVAVSALAGAGVALALNLAPNPFALAEIATWLMGSLEDRSFTDVAIALPCIAAGLALLLWDGRALDALTLGDDGARSLGVDVARVRLRLLAGTAIGVGGAVAVAGAIGFVGLIVPHLVRPLTDRSPSSVLLPSALGGAVLLIAADIGVRLVPSATELRLGVVMAFLGVPVFLLVLRRARGVWS